MDAVSLLAAGVLAAGCPSAPVSFGANEERPAEQSPWVAAGVGAQRIVGILYSYEETLGDARVRQAAGLVVYAGSLHQVAWFPRRWSGTAKGFLIEARRIDGPGAFRLRSDPRGRAGVLSVDSEDPLCGLLAPDVTDRQPELDAPRPCGRRAGRSAV